jgi:hypothetical protein
MTTGESTNKHLSLGRDVWCGTQLNTNTTHDIPLACPAWQDGSGEPEPEG